MIHDASHFCHVIRVAWVAISMHACDPVPIVMGPPELSYNIAHDWSYLSHHSMCLIAPYKFIFNNNYPPKAK